MLKNILVLDDGSEIVAGYVGQNAIMSLSHTAMVSSTTDLVPGAACSAKIEVTIWVEPGGSLVITSGTRMRYYREDASGDRTLVGTFWAVKPTRQTRNTYKVLAYDRMTLLDKDLSPWLREQQGAFPMTVKALVQAVCAQCGVEIVPGNLEAQVNTGYNVPAFYTDNLTGRQVIQWAAQAMCRFARMTPAGQLEFAWYTDHARSGIGPGAGSAWTALDLSGQLLATADGEVWTFAQPQAGYFSGTLSYEDYQVAPIDKVHIRQSQDDVGVIYPPGETATNALVLQGNLLLATQTADALRPVARAIFEQMQDVTYTPLQVSIPLDAGAPAPGEIITVTDAYGRTMTTYIMQRTISGQKVTLESTGNARRDGTSAVNNQKWQNLQGKMLEIQADVDGLRITASDLAGGMASLNLTVDGLRTEVSGKLGEADAKTMIEQGLESLTLTAESDAEAKDIKGDAQWADMGGNATVTDGVLTIVGTTQESIASLYVPADNLPGLGGRKITYTFEYKVNETVSGEACDVILWYDYQNEAGGGYYVLRITTGPGDTAQPTDWTPVSWTIEMKRDTIKKLQFAASIKKNAQGSVSIRNVGITTEAESNSSTLVLRAGGTELSSTQVKITGVVTFADLSGSGTTVINGDNIKTGTIQGTGGSSLWSLDSGTFISGMSDSTRVEINFNGIRWYSSNYLTGVLYSEYGKTYLGSNSTYTFLGWFSSGYPSISANKQKYDDNFGGLYYDHGSRLIHCVAEKFEIPGRIECESLSVNGREI